MENDLSSQSVECVVIGAGAVGLAIAAKMAEKYEVIVIESGELIGSGVSSRSSEVIHAGIYYQPNSLKAKLCLQGSKLLYSYCKSRALFNDRCGKLIVACDTGEVKRLHEIMANAKASGVSDLSIINVPELNYLEPQLSALAALHSPNTGIFDSHQYMLSMQGDLERRNGIVAFNSRVSSVTPFSGGFKLKINDSTTPDITTRLLINAAGLGANELAHNIYGFPKTYIPKLYLEKGNYFTINGESVFSRLIYPLPSEAGLGVHLTFDENRRIRFGPDVEWVDEASYSVDKNRGGSFQSAIKRYWPGFSGELTPDYAGVRPKLVGPKCDPVDFRIDGEAIHGYPGLVNLFGIESPGLTASMAIAQYVSRLTS